MPEVRPSLRTTACLSTLPESASTPSTSTGLSFMVPCVQEPLTGHVSLKLKEAIQQGQFVELGKLSRDTGCPQTGERSKGRRLTLLDGDLVVEDESSPVTSFYRWFDCFIVFTTIRGRSHPAELIPMSAHMEHIKSLFAQSKDGAAYDKQFRILRADCPNLPWGMYMPQLIVDKPAYARKQTPRQSPAAAPAKQASAPSTKPRGENRGRYCHSFNKAACTRDSCVFMHKCWHCDGRHAGKDCSSKRRQ